MCLKVLHECLSLLQLNHTRSVAQYALIFSAVPSKHAVEITKAAGKYANDADICEVDHGGLPLVRAIVMIAVPDSPSAFLPMGLLYNKNATRRNYF